jgi:hypothetical protein
MASGTMVTGNMDYLRRPFVRNIRAGHRVLVLKTRLRTLYSFGVSSRKLPFASAIIRTFRPPSSGRTSNQKAFSPSV